ncbi:MAG: ARPP-1 family domain-containing protein [Syntrophobacteria bacterium]
MQAIIQNYLKKAKIGRKQSHQNLAIFPLLSSYTNGLDYITLDEALSEGLIEVVEVSEEGTVPELKVVNKSPCMILILDGEELVGAKQNRIVNTTILIQEKTTTVIPVSCVEQGRWAHTSPRFDSEERLMAAQLRAMKSEQVHRSIRNSDDYYSDQAAIWREISRKARRMRAESPTMAMSEIYQKKRASLDGYINNFRLVEMQVGAVFMINGKVVGLDCFGKPETFSKVFRKLVESYALDAIDWSEQEKSGKALKSDVTKFLWAASAASVESRPSVGLGMDCRLESYNLTGFALAHEGQVLHFSVFARRNGYGEERYSSRMQRFSTRRRRR